MTQRTGTAGTIRRVATTATAVLAATTFLVGCGSKNESTGGSSAATTGNPAASPSVDPKSALLAAVPDEQDGAFRFTGTDGAQKISGALDPATKAMEIRIVEKVADPGFTMDMTFRVIEERGWMKVKVSGMDGLQEMMKIPTRWMALDSSKIKEDAPAYAGTDPGDAGLIIGTADTVTAKGDGTYTGFADLTRGTEVAKAFNSVDVTALGEAGRKVPFTAVVGADGNLASLVLDIPAAGKQKATKYSIKYFDFGKGPKLPAPTGNDVQKAPAEAYEMLNG